ncbi:unnamed protein product [Leuciscus chuanchicus]
MKAGNLTGWNISVFAFLNKTELYTGPQNDQRLFYCYLPPDNSKCPDLNMSTEEPTQQNTSHPRQNTSILKTTSSAKPITSSLKTTTISSQVTASTHELKCQTTSSSFLFYYQEHNETARSAVLPVTQTKKEGWGVITSVWLALVLTVVVVALLSVGCLIFKSKHSEYHFYKSINSPLTLGCFQFGIHNDNIIDKMNITLNKSFWINLVFVLFTLGKSQLLTVVPVSASRHQLSKPTENLMSNVPDVSIEMYSMSDDDVFFEISSTVNRTEENLLRVADRMYKKRLSPIFEITDENEEEEQCNAPDTKEEFKKSHQLQHLAAQGNCEPSTSLHHRNNFSCSSHKKMGALTL